MANIGKITQVIGSTFDAEFSASNMPPIYNAVTAEIDAGGNKRTLYGEISKHLGGGRVRCVALGSTEGLRRGADCVDTCLLYTSPSPRDRTRSRMPSSA